MTFTEAEYAYLTERSLGRLASVGPDGAPQIHPVTYWMDVDNEAIDISGPRLSMSQKFRNVEADARVAFVVDDLATPQDTIGPDGQLGRGLEIRGRVHILRDEVPLLAGFSKERLRVHPHRVIAWNLDGPGTNARNVGPAPPC